MAAKIGAIMPPATDAAQLRYTRRSLQLSQSKLARLSGVSRYKICDFELGSGELSPVEQERIRRALRTEAERLRKVSTEVALVRPASEPGKSLA